MRAPTGEQFALRRTEPSEVSAIVTEVAAGLRDLVVGGVRLVETFPEDATPPSACGITLAPWPNRVAGGRWMLGEAPQQLAISEPKYGNASHGLLRYTAYRVLHRSEDAVRLGAVAYPQQGWPFTVDHEVQYTLAGDGLTVSHTLRNAGAGTAPVAVGAHPYLRIGDVPTAELTVRLEAATRTETDERQIPVRRVATAGTEFDFAEPRRLGDSTIDTTFGGLRVLDGRSITRLEAPDGAAVELWQDAAFGYTQLFTKPDFPRRTAGGAFEPSLAVAVEPMTAPPDALNTGTGLRWLQPGEAWTASWGIRYRPAGE